MPKELKLEAIRRLEAIKLDVPNFYYVKENPILLNITLGQIDGIINFIKANDQSNLWQDTIEYNKRLDASRSQSFLDTTPEFKPYA